MTQHATREWDTDAFFEAFNGPAGVTKLFSRYPNPPAPMTVTMWKSRKRIAPPWMARAILEWMNSGRDVRDLMLPIPWPAARIKPTLEELGL